MSTNPEPEPLRERLARALYEAEVDMLFHAVEQLTFDYDEIRRFLLSLREESDRALAIVAAAYIDDTLKQWLTAALNPKAPGGVASLFQPFGPLDSFSSRVRLASALNWLSEPVCTSLDAIRRIRNEFAHRPFLSGYDDPKVSAALNSMPAWERDLEAALAKDGHSFRELTRREVFHLRAGMTLLHAASEISSAPLATRGHLSPFAAAHAPFDRLPEPLRELSLAVADGLMGLVHEAISRSPGKPPP
jgi:hypothetical protein